MPVRSDRDGRGRNMAVCQCFGVRVVCKKSLWNVRGESMSFLNLSQNLTRLRKEKKITQEELAEFVGVTKASVSKWETGVSQTKRY